MVAGGGDLLFMETTGDFIVGLAVSTPCEYLLNNGGGLWINDQLAAVTGAFEVAVWSVVRLSSDERRR